MPPKNNLINMTDEAKESYMQDIKNILSGGIGVGSYQKDFLDEENLKEEYQRRIAGYN